MHKEKRNLLKSGYCSGASIPKVETEGGRSQDNWLVYCHKWLAMEELKEDKYTKGILHRSFKLKMLAGDVDYNIKDVIRFADDPQYKILQDEIFDLRKRLFCYRLLHHKDPIPFVELNVKGRTAELTNPLIRLFQNSPVALEKILDSLSMFTQERNESNVNSFESKLHQSIESLLNERMLEPPTNDSVLKTYEFTNQAIKDKLIEITEAQPDPEKNNMYYSPEIGAFSQTKITNILKSKFKVESTRAYINGKTVRCVEFKKEYLDRIKATYNIPKKIEIIKPRPKTKSSDGTDGTDGNTGYRANPEEGSTTENKENDIEIIQEVTKIDENSNISYDNDKSNPSKDNSNDLVYPKMPSEVSVLSEVSEPEKPEGATYICKNCNKEQFTSCWELHKESCKGPYEGG